MIKRILRNKKIKSLNSYVEPDEIFLDSENIQHFDTQQFEGRIETPVSKNSIRLISIFFLFFGILFLGRLGYLQITKGEAYLKRSQNNTLDKDVLFADRGIIYDRNKKELVWNVKQEGQGDFSTRSYMSPGFSHVLGYVSYPAKDKSGRYWKQEFVGKDGIEKQYNDKLQGINGVKIIENDVRGVVYSENIINAPKRGQDLMLSIDSRIQSKLFDSIKNLSEKVYFKGGAGVIMDVTNGEIISSVSYPEYSSEILSQGKDKEIIKNYFSDKRKVFLDRTLSGLYTPGSIVKPFVALGALQEGIIDPFKKILSTGSISIPNPYNPKEKTVFKDWKAHGWVDMRRALAVSSDVYFYEVSGGFEGQKGLGILNIEKYSTMFGIGQKTGVDVPDEVSGVIPSPEWKIKNFNGDPWRVGNTYHTAIGQYGYQVTLMQMVRATSAIANKGTLLTPHFILSDLDMQKKNISIDYINNEYYQIIHEGMEQAVKDGGTAIALNVPYVKVAAKTGTAQLGVAKDRVNSWVIGFFPYDHPKYAFTLMMESGPKTNGIGASAVMREVLDYMNQNTPEYFE